VLCYTAEFSDCLVENKAAANTQQIVHLSVCCHNDHIRDEHLGCVWFNLYPLQIFSCRMTCNEREIERGEIKLCANDLFKVKPGTIWKYVAWLTDPRCSKAEPNISGSETQEQGIPGGVASHLFSGRAQSSYRPEQ
jgi:hypothetical protein